MPGAPAVPELAGSSAEPSGSPPRRRRRLWPPSRRGRILLGCTVLLVLLALVGWAVADAVLARGKLTAAKDQLQSLADAPALTRPAAERQLRSALDETAAADRLLGQPASVVLAHIPVLGRSWVAERTIAQVSRTVLTQLDGLVSDASAVGTGGHVDLAALSRLHDALLAAERAVAPDLRALAGLRTGLTPGPVGAGVREAQQRLLPVGPDLAKAAAGAAALQDIFGGNGPRTVMIGLQNNAELRATGGLLGSFAFGRSHDGSLHVGRFRDVNPIAQSPGFARRVPSPPDFAAAYHPFLADTTLWKNVNFSPSVPDSAQVLAAVAQRSTGIRPDTVLLLDVPAVAALLDGSGATVTLPDGTVATGTTLENDLLVQSYGATPNTAAAETKRRRGIERAADGALRTALNTPPSLSLLIALGEQIAGRHITVWSDHPGIQSDLVAAGAAGTVGSASGLVAYAASDNLGDSPGTGNKLDFYAQRSVDVRVAAGTSRATVQETVRIHNTAPPGLPPYVGGVRHPGRLQELWNVVIPRNAQDVAVDVDGQPVAGNVEAVDGRREILLPVTTQRGATSVIRWEYSVAVSGRRFQLDVIPQPLAHPATLSLDVYGTGGASVSNPVVTTEPFLSAVTLDEQVH